MGDEKPKPSLPPAWVPVLQQLIDERARVIAREMIAGSRVRGKWDSPYEYELVPPQETSQNSQAADGGGVEAGAGQADLPVGNLAVDPAEENSQGRPAGAPGVSASPGLPSCGHPLIEGLCLISSCTAPKTSESVSRGTSGPSVVSSGVISRCECACHHPFAYYFHPDGVCKNCPNAGPSKPSRCSCERDDRGEIVDYVQDCPEHGDHRPGQGMCVPVKRPLSSCPCDPTIGENCPDCYVGPAKEAAPGDGPVSAPAPQPGTATEAPFGGDNDAAWQLAAEYAEPGSATRLAAEIRNLMKREREAVAHVAADRTAHLPSVHYIRVMFERMLSNIRNGEPIESGLEDD